MREAGQPVDKSSVWMEMKLSISRLVKGVVIRGGAGGDRAKEHPTMVKVLTSNTGLDFDAVRDEILAKARRCRLTPA